MHVGVKKPSRKIWLKKTVAARSRIRSGSRPAAASRSRSVSGSPLTRSKVATRLPVRCQSTRGTRKPASSAQFSANSLAAAASRRRSSSRRVVVARDLTVSTGR
jgi:hypothetical protein